MPRVRVMCSCHVFVSRVRVTCSCHVFVSRDILQIVGLLLFKTKFDPVWMDSVKVEKS